MKFSIYPKPPFSFDLVAGLYSRFPTQCVDIYGEGVYERALEVKERIYLIKVKSIGLLNEPKLLVEVLPEGETIDKQSIEEKIKWMLGTEDEIKEFYKIGLKDRKFSQIIRNLYGLRPTKTPTVFEALIIAISEQQIALPVALAIRKRLVEKYGESITIGEKKYYAFPSAEALAQAKSAEIKELKFSSKKADYMIDVSTRVVNNELNLETMKGGEINKVTAILSQIKGLGPWTIAYMLCRGMGRYETLPAADMGLRTSVTNYLREKEKVSEREVRKVLEPFGKYRGYAAFYLIYNYAFQKYPKN